MPRHFRKILLSVLLVFCSTPSFASSITPQSSQITFMSNSSFPVDYLHISPPSSSGISINRFNSFTVDGKALNIINPGSVGTRPATIVIVADDIILRDTVEIVGDAADIVFLSPDSSGSIECSDCVFKNNFRVTLAVTTGEPSFTSSQLGTFNITTSSSGNILIDGMHAPGALNVDVMAASVDTRETLSLHQAVNRDANGGYVSNDSGSLTMGTGSLQFITGANRWSYDDQILQGTTVEECDYYEYYYGEPYLVCTNPSVGTSVLSGNLRALNVKVLSSAELDLDANINTKTDAVASVRYNGNVKLAQEGVQINSFVTDGSHNLVDLQVSSDGRVAINTMSQFSLGSGSQISGREVELISSGSITQLGRITGGEISVASNNFTNEGWMTADRLLEVWAEGRIINRSGGQIIADTVSLQTNLLSYSYIMNGSRTPTERLASSLLDIDEDYFDNIDHTKIGTYYTAGLHLDSNSSWRNGSKPSQTSAHILGRNIYIQTRAFENVNPYYEFVDEFSEGLVADRSLINQVSVIAEDKLEIDADEYVLNSSALLGAESAGAQVRIQANTLSNERYRVLAMLDVDYYSQSGEFVDTGKWEDGEPIYYNDTTTTETIETKMATFSPPGVLYSMGNFEFASANNSASNPVGLFLNAIGYFEVFGEAKFNTGRVLDVGLENQGITRNESVRNYSLRVRNDVATNDFVVDPEEMDSLFYVGGVARAGQTNTSQFFNFSPFKGYLRMALDDLMQNYDFVGDGTSVPMPGNSGADQISFSYDLYSSLDSWLDYDDQIGSYPQDEFTITWYEERTVFLPGTSAGDGTFSAGSTDTYSIFDEIKNLFENLVDSFVEILNEIKWW